MAAAPADGARSAAERAHGVGVERDALLQLVELKVVDTENRRDEGKAVQSGKDFVVEDRKSGERGQHDEVRVTLRPTMPGAWRAGAGRRGSARGDRRRPWRAPGNTAI